jgi:hypothetical protein
MGDIDQNRGAPGRANPSAIRSQNGDGSITLHYGQPNR